MLLVEMGNGHEAGSSSRKKSSCGADSKKVKKFVLRISPRL